MCLYAHIPFIFDIIYILVNVGIKEHMTYDLGTGILSDLVMKV